MSREVLSTYTVSSSESSSHFTLSVDRPDAISLTETPREEDTPAALLTASKSDKAVGGGLHESVFTSIRHAADNCEARRAALLSRVNAMARYRQLVRSNRAADASTHGSTEAKDDDVSRTNKSQLRSNHSDAATMVVVEMSAATPTSLEESIVSRPTELHYRGHTRSAPARDTDTEASILDTQTTVPARTTDLLSAHALQATDGHSRTTEELTRAEKDVTHSELAQTTDTFFTSMLDPPSSQTEATEGEGEGDVDAATRLSYHPMRNSFQPNFTPQLSHHRKSTELTSGLHSLPDTRCTSAAVSNDHTAAHHTSSSAPHGRSTRLTGGGGTCAKSCTNAAAAAVAGGAAVLGSPAGTVPLVSPDDAVALCGGGAGKTAFWVRPSTALYDMTASIAAKRKDALERTPSVSTSLVESVASSSRSSGRRSSRPRFVTQFSRNNSRRETIREAEAMGGTYLLRSSDAALQHRGGAGASSHSSTTTTAAAAVGNHTLVASVMPHGQTPSHACASARESEAADSPTVITAAHGGGQTSAAHVAAAGKKKKHTLARPSHGPASYETIHQRRCETLGQSAAAPSSDSVVGSNNSSRSSCMVSVHRYTSGAFSACTLDSGSECGGGSARSRAASLTNGSAAAAAAAAANHASSSSSVPPPPRTTRMRGSVVRTSTSAATESIMSPRESESVQRHCARLGAVRHEAMRSRPNAAEPTSARTATTATRTTMTSTAAAASGAKRATVAVAARRSSRLLPRASTTRTSDHADHHRPLEESARATEPPTECGHMAATAAAPASHELEMSCRSSGMANSVTVVLSDAAVHEAVAAELDMNEPQPNCPPTCTPSVCVDSNQSVGVGVRTGATKELDDTSHVLCSHDEEENEEDGGTLPVADDDAAVVYTSVGRSAVTSDRPRATPTHSSKSRRREQDATTSPVRPSIANDRATRSPMSAELSPLSMNSNEGEPQESSHAENGQRGDAIRDEEHPPSLLQSTPCRMAAVAAADSDATRTDVSRTPAELVGASEVHGETLIAMLRTMVHQTCRVMPCYLCAEMQSVPMYRLHIKMCRDRTRVLLSERMGAEGAAIPMGSIAAMDAREVPTMASSEEARREYCRAAYGCAKLLLQSCCKCAIQMRVHDVKQHELLCGLKYYTGSKAALRACAAVERIQAGYVED